MNNTGSTFCTSFPYVFCTGIITNGGGRPNIIPGKTSLEYYIRTANDKDLSTLESKVRKCIEGAAIATGCEVWFMKFE